MNLKTYEVNCIHTNHKVLSCNNEMEVGKFIDKFEQYGNCMIENTKFAQLNFKDIFFSHNNISNDPSVLLYFTFEKWPYNKSDR